MVKYYNIEKTEVLKFKEDLAPVIRALSELRGRNLYQVSDSCRKHLDTASEELIKLLKGMEETYLRSADV